MTKICSIASIGVQHSFISCAPAWWHHVQSLKFHCGVISTLTACSPLYAPAIINYYYWCRIICVVCLKESGEKEKGNIALPTAVIGHTFNTLGESCQVQICFSKLY